MRNQQFRTRAAVAATLLALGLSACAPVPEELAPLPSAEVIKATVTRAYQNTYGRAPQNLRVVKVDARPLVGSRPDHYVCLLTDERQPYPVYNNDGQLIHAVGDPYTGSHVALIRDYGSQDGWGTGVLRHVIRTNKLGFVPVEELCPLSEY